MPSIGVIMNPISRINIKKDTSFAMMLGLQQREHTIFYLEPSHVWLQDGIAWGKMHRIQVMDDAHQWYQILDTIEQPLSHLNVILMRLDPPVDTNFITITHLLSLAEQQGCVILNSPQGLRDTNEKLATQAFPQCTPPQIVTHQRKPILDFVSHHGKAVLKPLNSMGGGGIFQLRDDDTNLNTIIEQATHNFTQRVIVQQYIPAIRKGDKRIIIINGKAAPYALLRKPTTNDFRGNISAGASPEVCELTDRDHWIVNQVAASLCQRGLHFVGLDVIGDYLTEINVTSPTCVREIEAGTGTSILTPWYEFIEKVSKKH